VTPPEARLSDNLDFMRLDTFDLKNAKVVPPHITRVDSTIVLPVNFPEAHLYSLLKALFGRPRGFMSIAIDLRGDPDAPFKYQYSLELWPNAVIDVTRSWLNVEVLLHGLSSSSDELVRMFTHNFKLHNDMLNQVFQNLEPYRLLVNPYHRHRRNVNFFYTELDSLKIAEPHFPKTLVASRKEQKHHLKTQTAYLRNMDRQNIFSTSLVTESAFMAEAYLNLVFALLAKPEVKASKETFNDILRSKWKERLERLMIYCNHVANVPDFSSTDLTNAKRLFDLRNRIAHSYPDVDALCLDKIWFDDQIPILPRCEAFDSYQVAVETHLPSRHEALNTRGWAEDFVKAVDNLLDDTGRQSVQLMAATHPLGYSDKTHKYGVPFLPKIFKSFFG
jgi:hypothetical protein